MFGKLFDWLDHRTGYRKLMDAMLLEHIPGGAKWRYVWGSTLAFVFMIQLVTGVLLMTAYSPGDSTAWGSVYFIQYEMDFGWLIRGLHHFGSQTMVVLLGIHMLQVVIAGAHLPPREINWWLGLALMGVVLGLGLTGYLLPWDQKGFFATQVATNILSSLPAVGPFLQRAVVGGPVYGNHTLTHFYALHVGILPPLLIVLLIAHIAVFRRHGLTTSASPTYRGPGYVFHASNVFALVRDLGIGFILAGICRFFHIPWITSGIILGLFLVFALSRLSSRPKEDGVFWPDQAFRDLVVCLFVFGVMMSLVVFGGHGNKIEVPAGQETDLYQRLSKAGRDGLGANLDAPADPLTPEYPARPEWYFLFLFQLLKYFDEEMGAVVIPNAVGGLLFLLPLFGYGRMRKFGHVLGVLVVVALLAAVCVLTFLAIADDSPTPYPLELGGGTENAKELHKKFAHAEVEARRAVQLASQGIPEQGGRYLLRGDPWTKGPKLIETNCAVCHKFSPTDRPGFEGFNDPKLKYKASDLGDFGSEKWIRGLLDNPGDDKYFGLTKLKGMKEWKSGVMAKRADMSKEQIKEQEEEFGLIAAWLVKPQAERDQDSKAKKAFFKKKSCGTCHTVDKDGGESAPNLTDYGSAAWIRFMIMSPAHTERHGDKNDMPAFRNLAGPGAEVYSKEFQESPNKAKETIHLSNIDRELIIRWMTRDYRVVFGGQPIAGAPK